MRKIISIVLAVLMMCSICVNCSASEKNYVPSEICDSKGNTVATISYSEGTMSYHWVKQDTDYGNIFYYDGIQYLSRKPDDFNIQLIAITEGLNPLADSLWEPVKSGKIKRIHNYFNQNETETFKKNSEGQVTSIRYKGISPEDPYYTATISYSSDGKIIGYSTSQEPNDSFEFQYKNGKLYRTVNKYTDSEGPESIIRDIKYDSNGKMKSYIFNKNASTIIYGLSNGYEFNFSYDSKGRLTQISSGCIGDFTYDSNNCMSKYSITWNRDSGKDTYLFKYTIM